MLRDISSRSIFPSLTSQFSALIGFDRFDSNLEFVLIDVEIVDQIVAMLEG